MMRRNLYVIVLYSNVTGACGSATDQPPEHAATAQAESPPIAADSTSTKPATPPAAAPPSPSTSKAVAGPPKLRAEIHDDMGHAQNELSVDCNAMCFTIEAAAAGGNPPYTFTWEDGSHDAKRELCPSADTHIKLEAQDTAQETAEFMLEAQHASAQLDLRVQGCGTVGDKGVKQCRAAPPANCELGNGIVLPEELTVDVSGGTVQYYAHGAVLPTGRYRLTYIDGCATFGGKPSDGLNVGWTVNGQNSMAGVWGCYLAGDDGSAFAVAPGTVGTFAGPSTDDGTGGAFMTYAECVEANCDIPALDFDFPGGKLGVGRDGGGIGSVDDLGGEAEGGVSPTFRLSRMDGCQ